MSNNSNWYAQSMYGVTVEFKVTNPTKQPANCCFCKTKISGKVPKLYPTVGMRGRTYVCHTCAKNLITENKKWVGNYHKDRLKVFRNYMKRIKNKKYKDIYTLEAL
jgi:hypothetical protein